VALVDTLREAVAELVLEADLVDDAPAVPVLLVLSLRIFVIPLPSLALFVVELGVILAIGGLPSNRPRSCSFFSSSWYFFMRTFKPRARLCNCTAAF
jgi:hypothetical protein